MIKHRIKTQATYSFLYIILCIFLINTFPGCATKMATSTLMIGIKTSHELIVKKEIKLSDSEKFITFKNGVMNYTPPIILSSNSQHVEVDKGIYCVIENYKMVDTVIPANHVFEFDSIEKEIFPNKKINRISFRLKSGGHSIAIYCSIDDGSQTNEITYGQFLSAVGSYFEIRKK